MIVDALSTFTQDATFSEDVTIEGNNLIVDALSTFTENATFSADVTIEGNELNITAFSTFTGDTNFDGDVTIEGNNLIVNALSTFEGEATFIGDVTIEGNNLIVDAISTFVGDSFFSGIVDIDGTELNVNAITTFTQDATFSENVNIDGTELIVSAISTFEGDSTFIQNVTIGLTDYIGDATPEFLVYENSTFYNDITVDSFSTFVEEAIFESNVIIDENLSVGGTGFFGEYVKMYGGLGVSGQLGVGGTGYFAKNLNVAGNLGISGSSTFQGNSIFNAQLNTTNQLNVGSTGFFTILPTCTPGLIPSESDQLVNKLYLDTIASGLKPKESVQCATIGNITLSGLQTIDGYTTLSGDRVLVKDQGYTSSGYSGNTANGIYVASSSAWSRSSDYDIGYTGVASFMFVQNGTTNKNNIFIEILDPGIVGTDPLLFTIFSDIFFNIGQGLEYVGDNTLQVKNNLNFVNNVGTNATNLVLGTQNYNTIIYSNLGVTGTSEFKSDVTFLGDISVASGSTATFNGNTEINNVYVKNNSNISFDTSSSGIIGQPSGTGTNILQKTYITSNTASQTSSNSLIVYGGIGITGKAYITGDTHITSITNAGDNTGALVVTGGVYIGESLRISSGLESGGSANIKSNIVSNSITSGALIVGGGVGIGQNINIGSTANIGGITTITSTQTSDTYQYGALVVYGGVGISGAINVKNNANIAGITRIISTTTSTNYNNGALIVYGGVGISGAANIKGNTNIYSTQSAEVGTSTAALYVAGGVGIGGNIYVTTSANIGGITNITSNTQSTGSTSGALVVNGGVGIGGAVHIGTTINATSSATENISNIYSLNVTNLNSSSTYQSTGNYYLKANGSSAPSWAVVSQYWSLSSNTLSPSTSYSINTVSIPTLTTTNLNSSSSYQSTSNYYLKANGSSAPIWAQISSTTEYWSLSSNTLSPTSTSYTVSATSFRTTSDYRIKENVENLDETYNVNNLRPVTYNNKLTNSKDIGLIAHELQEVYPYLVNGEKDDENYQSVNYIGLIPILIKEIKDLKKRVNELESAKLS